MKRTKSTRSRCWTKSIGRWRDAPTITSTSPKEFKFSVAKSLPSARTWPFSEQFSKNSAKSSSKATSKPRSSPKPPLSTTKSESSRSKTSRGWCARASGSAEATASTYHFRLWTFSRACWKRRRVSWYSLRCFREGERALWIGRWRKSWNRTR